MDNEIKESVISQGEEEISEAAELISNADEAAGESEEIFESSDESEVFDGVSELAEMLPELCEENADELFDTARYSELRELGLTPREAYLATAKAKPVFDSRAHLSSAVPKGAKSPTARMTASELRAARELFSGASDQEIIRLYKRVTN